MNYVLRKYQEDAVDVGVDFILDKNKKKHSASVVKMANYAKNFGCSVKGKGKGPTAEDVTGDGQYTKKDFLVNIGVLNPDGSKKKKDDNKNKGRKGKGPKSLESKK